MNTAPLGLIAGEGVFPVLVARGARAAGRPVVCAALSQCAWPALREDCDVFQWVGILRMGKWIRVLRAGGCREAIMVGRVAPSKLHDRWRLLRYIPDLRTAMLLPRIVRDKRPETILKIVIEQLSRSGIQLIDSTQYCSEHLVTAGVLTRRQPTASQWEDIRRGWGICQNISRMDVGQAIAIRDLDVIAVEAKEGTNGMIERAGQLCKGGGWTMIKVSNTTHDMRVDVPTIGKLHAAGASCCVLEPGKTIMLEKEKVLELADKYKMAVVGYVPTE